MICNLVSLQGHVDADIDGYVVIMEIGTVQECDLLSECEMCCLWVDLLDLMNENLPRRSVSPRTSSTHPRKAVLDF